MPVLADDFKQDWQKVKGLISQMYYDKKNRSDEMNKRFDKFEKRAVAAKNQSDFAGIINQMIDEYGDSHFAFVPSDTQFYYTFDGMARGDNAIKMPHIGAWFKISGGKWTVQMVMEGMEAEKMGLRKGDEIVEVDGKLFHPIRSFEGKEGTTVKFSWLHGSEKKTGEAKVSLDIAQDMFMQGMKNSTEIITKDGKRIGYIHLWTQNNAKFRDLLNSTIMTRFLRTDGLIIDNRDGFGGIPNGFGDPLFVPDTTVKFTGPTVSQEQHMGYGKPVVSIINEGSRSAKEVFSAILKKTKRAQLVGHNTAGHVLGTTPIRVNDWSYIEIPIVNVEVEGVKLEKVGVAPDFLVKDEFDAAGNDLFKAKAIEVLMDTIARNK